MSRSSHKLVNSSCTKYCGNLSCTEDTHGQPLKRLGFLWNTEDLGHWSSSAEALHGVEYFKFSSGISYSLCVWVHCWYWSIHASNLVGLFCLFSSFDLRLILLCVSFRKFDLEYIHVGNITGNNAKSKAQCVGCVKPWYMSSWLPFNIFLIYLER